MNQSAEKTSPALVAAAWIIVAIPLGWGFYQSVVKSKPLFNTQGAHAVAPNATGRP